MKLHYKYSSIPAMKAKCAAWLELFGNAPRVKLCGTWKEKDGELVFTDGMVSDSIVSIGSKGVQLRVDGSISSVTGTASSAYTLEPGDPTTPA